MPQKTLSRESQGLGSYPLSVCTPKDAAYETMASIVTNTDRQDNRNTTRTHLESARELARIKQQSRFRSSTKHYLMRKYPILCGLLSHRQVLPWKGKHCEQAKHDTALTQPRRTGEASRCELSKKRAQIQPKQSNGLYVFRKLGTRETSSQVRSWVCSAVAKHCSSTTLGWGATVVLWSHLHRDDEGIRYRRGHHRNSHSEGPGGSRHKTDARTVQVLSKNLLEALSLKNHLANSPRDFPLPG